MLITFMGKNISHLNMFFFNFKPVKKMFNVDSGVIIKEKLIIILNTVEI